MLTEVEKDLVLGGGKMEDQLEERLEDERIGSMTRKAGRIAKAVLAIIGGAYLSCKSCQSTEQYFSSPDQKQRDAERSVCDALRDNDVVYLPIEIEDNDAQAIGGYKRPLMGSYSIQCLFDDRLVVSKYQIVSE